MRGESTIHIWILIINGQLCGTVMLKWHYCSGERVCVLLSLIFFLNMKTFFLLDITFKSNEYLCSLAFIISHLLPPPPPKKKNNNKKTHKKNQNPPRWCPKGENQTYNNQQLRSIYVICDPVFIVCLVLWLCSQCIHVGFFHPCYSGLLWNL